MAKGWIKLYRCLLDKAIWRCSTPAQKAVLITVLLMANHEDKEWEWQGQKYICKPGQFISSLSAIADKAGVTIQSVRSALKKFEKYDFLTNQSTKDGRLITIVNWEFYQGIDELPNKAPTKTSTNQIENFNKEANKEPNKEVNKDATTANASIFNTSTPLEVATQQSSQQTTQQSTQQSISEKSTNDSTTNKKNKEDIINNYNNIIILTPDEAQFLEVLQTIPNYPYDRNKDLAMYYRLKERYPQLDLIEAIKDWATYKLDKPLKEGDNPRSQINTACKKYIEWGRNLKKEDGKSDKLHSRMDSRRESKASPYNYDKFFD